MKKPGICAALAVAILGAAGVHVAQAQVVKVDGSSTVFPVTEAVAEDFQKAKKGTIKVTVGISGTGGGFKRFCRGESDVQNATRPILKPEMEDCKKAGVEYIELPVAFDALTVVAHPKNTFLNSISVEDLKKMWEPAAQGKITRWNQVNPAWPNAQIKLFGAGPDSGTFDYFTEAIMGKAKSSRGDFTASEDDNVLVQGVSKDANALGYFGLAYYAENLDKLKAVAVDAKGDGTCVAPSIETVNQGTYQPLSRPLFIYVRREAASQPHVRAYLNFYLSTSYTPLIQSREVGYVALSDRLYEAATKRFNADTTGTLFPKGAEV